MKMIHPIAVFFLMFGMLMFGHSQAKYARKKASSLILALVLIVVGIFLAAIVGCSASRVPPTVDVLTPEAQEIDPRTRALGPKMPPGKTPLAERAKRDDASNLTTRGVESASEAGKSSARDQLAGSVAEQLGQAPAALVSPDVEPHAPPAPGYHRVAIAWTDDTETLCTACSPKKQSKLKAKKRRK